jgi:hypothetical protein
MSHAARVWITLGTVYVSGARPTSGIELTGETIPPLFAVGVRFLAAALLMLGFGVEAWHAVLRVSRHDSRLALIGALCQHKRRALRRGAASRPASPRSSSAVPLRIVLLRTINGDRPPPALVGVLVSSAGSRSSCGRTAGRRSGRCSSSCAPR